MYPILPSNISFSGFIPQTYAFPNSLNLGCLPQNEYLDAMLQYKKYCNQIQTQRLYFLNQIQNITLLNSLNEIQEKQINLNVSKQAHESCEFKLQESFRTLKERDPQEENPVTDTILNKKNIREFFRSQVVNMLSYILSHVGKLNKDDFISQRNKFAHHQSLLKIFDILVEKYTSISKCREDMIRFVLRKALSFIRNSLKDQYKLTNKAASILLCQRYFENRSEEMLKKQIDLDDEEKIVNFLLPYKKNSRNKTANACFITEIFTSEIFYQDYLTYLEKFDQIYDSDNQKKIEKFADFLVNCVEGNLLDKVKNYKRLPWLKTWKESSKVIAYELLSQNIWKFTNKKSKTEKEAQYKKNLN